MVDARTATATDFEKAAQRHAHAFWMWLVAAALVWWFASLVWALVPAALSIFSAVSSVSSTRNAEKLRNGSYPIPNPNNGLPDAGARDR